MLTMGWGFGHEWLLWLQGVLAGMADPWVIALVLALTTLLIEDLAIAAGVALATQGTIGWTLSFAAVGGGIALGDLGLFALGLGARRVPWLHRRYVHIGDTHWRARVEGQLASAVLFARVIPGLRLLTYTACGFVRVNFVAFTAWVVVAVALWTVGLYVLSYAVGSAIAMRLDIPVPIAVALPIVALALAVPLARCLGRFLRSQSPAGARLAP
jgi:membrane protein DedA with SNARE-associated domain